MFKLCSSQFSGEKRNKNRRHQFTAEQKEVLEKSYAEKTYLKKDEIERIAELLGVELTSVKV